MSARRTLTGAALTFALAFLPHDLRAAAQQGPRQNQPAGVIPLQPMPNQIALGRNLFTGATPLANGGPACAACHAAASVRAGGGTMGPDLTGIARRIGPEGLESALQTLYFPTMFPLFATHQLTIPERTAIGAFLVSTDGQTSNAARDTLLIGGGALVGCFVLFAITAVLGRRRVSSVRRTRLPRSSPHRTARGVSS